MNRVGRTESMWHTGGAMLLVDRTRIYETGRGKQGMVCRAWMWI